MSVFISLHLISWFGYSNIAGLFAQQLCLQVQESQEAQKACIVSKTTTLYTLCMDNLTSNILGLSLNVQHLSVCVFIFVYLCVSYPFLSEVGVSGTLLGSGCKVFPSRSHSTSYFRHPDRDKRNLYNNVIKSNLCINSCSCCQRPTFPARQSM